MKNEKKLKMQPTRRKDGEGSFWTSYSDLLLGIAVIFLVLFIFSLLNSGVTQLNTSIEKKKQERILKGLVSEELIKQNAEGMEAIEKDIKDIEVKEKSISQSLQELAELKKAFEKRKEVLNRLFESDLQKNGQPAASERPA
ncbi:MAG: hypothetical protein HQK54_15865 [Oligoflexales bacterium]|nr:hypothetical protein [Oligoflexales bacterium]